jgi:uncharacterized protein
MSRDEKREEKIRRCTAIITELGRVAVAFSGGVDSTLLLSLCIRTVGTENVLAILGVSPSLPTRERDEARRLAEEMGVLVIELETDEFEDPAFTQNPADRCYHCKKSLYTRIWRIARERGFNSVVSGANADDPGDFRPGLDAGKEMGIRNPLMEAGLTKEDIRAASKSMGLPTWNKPAMACLASRIPYGSTITPERLKRVEKAEEALRGLGFGQCRVRDYDTLARIEVEGDLLEKAVSERARIVAALKAAGYIYVTLDLAGLKSGSMNAVLARK